jgi:hypothetical protein
MARIALDAAFQFQVQHRAHAGSLRACAYMVPLVRACKDGVEPLGIVGEMRQRHRAVLDEETSLPSCFIDIMT